MTKFDHALLRCDEDESFSIVPKGDIIHRGSLRSGVAVKFRFVDTSGKKKLYDGVVEDLGTSADYVRLVKKQNKLLKLQKQSKAAKPRKTKRSRRSESENLSDQELTSCDDIPESRDSGSSSSESSDLELTPAERELILKIKRKKKLADAKKLNQLANKSIAPSSPSSSMAPITPSTTITCSTPSTSSGASFESLVSPVPSLKPIASATHRKRKPAECKAFSGQMYLHCADDDNVQELHPSSGVYILKQELENVRSSAPSASAMARQLMRAIFSEEALHNCSLGGNIAFGQGRLTNISDTRAALDSKGVDTILYYTKLRQRKKVEYKRWKEMDDNTIKTRMRNLLCEVRFRNKKQRTDA